MKYQGRKLDGPRKVVVPVLRSENEGGNIYITVKAVTDSTPFYDKYPAPIPPVITRPGGKTDHKWDDKGYESEFQKWVNYKLAWTALESLSESGLEFESVDLNNPETWSNWQKELQSVFSEAEVNRIVQAMSDVNGLNEKLVEEARQTFLTGQADRVVVSDSPTAAAKNMPSGDAVSQSV